MQLAGQGTLAVTDVWRLSEAPAQPHVLRGQVRLQREGHPEMTPSNCDP